MQSKDKKYIHSDDKEYIEMLLKEYPRRDKVLKKLDLDIEELELSLKESNLRGINYSKDKIMTSNKTSSVEAQIIKIEKDIEDILKAKDRKIIHFDKIEIALEGLTDMQNKLIEYRFFKSFTWGMCEKYIGYTDRQCMNIVNDIIYLLNTYYNIHKPKKSS